MSKAERIKVILGEENFQRPDFLEGFDTAMIGIVRNLDNGESLPAYSYLSLVEALVAGGLSEEDAVDHIDNLIDPWTVRVILVDDTGV